MQSRTTAARLRIDSASLLEALSAGVVAIDKAGAVLYMNAAAENLLAISRTRAQGWALRDLVEDPQPLDELCAKSESTGATRTVRELQLVPSARPDVARICDVLATPGEQQQTILEFRDANTRVMIHSEAALLTQHEVARAMVVQLAHEIKNPLGGLRGAAQLLERRLGTAELKEYTAVVIKEADRLTQLVNEMLGPSGPAVRSATCIHRLLDHVRRLMAAEAPEGVSIIADYDPSLPDIEADEDRLLQAFLNLGRNAVQALGDAGDGEIVLRTRAEVGVTIGTRRHSQVMRIDFEDSGPGVPEAIRDRIFFPLVTGRERGTGIGLAVAQDLVSRHGGLIKLMPAQRTMFSVFLPLTVHKSGDNV